MRATRTLISTLLLGLGIALVSGSALADENKEAAPALAPPAAQVFGWIEEVMLVPGRRWKLNAKLDTGADTSSLDARDIKRVKFRDKSYVRFNVTDPATGERVSLRRPYVRSVRIRRHDGAHQRRRVVLMTVCLGDQERVIEVTLTDRTEFDYPLLLGRSALVGLAIVDPNAELTREPSCWAEVDEAASRELGSLPAAEPAASPAEE